MKNSESSKRHLEKSKSPFSSYPPATGFLQRQWSGGFIVFQQGEWNDHDRFAHFKTNLLGLGRGLAKYGLLAKQMLENDHHVEKQECCHGLDDLSLI